MSLGSILSKNTYFSKINFGKKNFKITIYEIILKEILKTSAILHNLYYIPHSFSHWKKKKKAIYYFVPLFFF